MNQKYIYEISEALCENHAALMIGAGFSKNAEKIAMTDKKFLDWNKLSDKFYEAVYGENKKPGKEYNSSLRLAQEVEISLGRPKLEKIIKNAVPDMEYAPSQLYIRMLELPWKDIFTTNYDTLLERAAEKVTKRRYNVVVSQNDLINSADATRIVKLHGSFPSYRPFIITEEDYRTYPVKFAAMVNTVQQALLENVFCMVGFSCEDPNFINWVGWINDNLGKSSSQKMYMVSVNHMEEPKRKLLFNQNIVVIDLQELWPKKNCAERLSAFFSEIQDNINEKQKKDNWFDLSKLNISSAGYKEKTMIMKRLIESYPGWIFLPWKMKLKTEYVLSGLGCFAEFDKLSLNDQIEYIYQYVRFFDICGRPILIQHADIFFDVLQAIVDFEQHEKQKNNMIQIIYLHLLRTYRESGEWGKYEQCHQKINIEFLNYDNKQFLYASDCWYALFRFDEGKLTGRLEKWELAKGDLYWPLIKASLLAMVGEVQKADNILMDNLVLVRKQLVKANGNEFLSSIEESVVSLINFIRQGNSNCNSNLEECIHDGELSWWNENDKYCLNINALEKKGKNYETNYNYDLSFSYTINFMQGNDRAFYALEYLRFLEQTGHPFRLRNVTNTKGMKKTIYNLAPYYPHWCLIQILIAQEQKQVDVLFGRANLAGISREQIDIMSNEYLNIFQTLIKNVNPQNCFGAKSIYEQAAVVLPTILARFCYKCSTNILDKLLEATVALCNSNVRKNFKSLDKLIKAIIKAFSCDEQKERINKILAFPMENDAINRYHDPIIYVRKWEKKCKLEMKNYNEALQQIRYAIESDDDNMKNNAIARLIILEQIIILEEADKQLLYDILEKEDSLENSYFLYVLDKQKFQKHIKIVLDKTIERIELDSQRAFFSSGSDNYQKLIQLIKELDIHDVKIKKVVDILAKLVTTNESWIKNNQFEAKERIRQSFYLVVGLIWLCRNAKKTLSQEEKESIKSYFLVLRKVYNDTIVIDLIGKLWVDQESVDNTYIKKQLWLSGNDGLQLLNDFYDMLQLCNYNIKEDKTIENATNLITIDMSYKLFNSELEDCLTSMKLYYSLLQFWKNTGQQITEMDIVDAYLLRIAEETIININDSEQEALLKLRCRIQACLIAKKLNESGIAGSGIDKWKETSQSEDEFVEIRKLAFSKNGK